MKWIVGIRREDKNQWERRVPLIPTDVTWLREKHGLEFLVQTSSIRVFEDDAYCAAGAQVVEELDAARVVLAVKEIPVNLLRPRKIYVKFSHVIKGQPYNMPMLARLMELGCSLVDYERITEDSGNRLIFFSFHAGFAGMLESLWCLGQRLEATGVTTPLSALRHAYEYGRLEEARLHLKEVGQQIADDGLDPRVSPLVVGIAGYGNVANGCQEILDCLPVRDVDVKQLPEASNRRGTRAHELTKVVFREEHMAQRSGDGGHPFDLQHYYGNPEEYTPCFEAHLPHLDMLINTIYWEPRYPRLLTIDWAQKQYQNGEEPRLRVVGDISCDIEGSVELTRRATQPDEPCYVVDPMRVDQPVLGVAGRGIAVMAVDNLPCEIPRESSEHFSASLKALVPALATADWDADLDDLEIPDCLRRALVLHKGQLTPDFRYLDAHLRDAGVRI